VKVIQNGVLAVTASCFLAFAGVACDNTARGVKQDAAEAAKDAEKAAAATKAEAKDLSADAKKAAGEAGAAIDAAKETFDVKKALTLDSTVDASNINVDTNHETMTVVLKGHVPNASMKGKAGRIAAQEAPNYKIDNQLVIKP